MTGELESRLHGPHSEEHTVQTAFLAAECVRFLNYAAGTADSSGLPYPGTAYDVTGNLQLAAQRLPQLFDLMVARMRADNGDGLLAASDRDPETVTDLVEDFAVALAEADRAAGVLAAALGRAQSALSDVNGRGPGREDGAL